MKIHIHILALVLILLYGNINAYGATITSNATGNWNVGGTWIGGVVPGSADNVIISGGHTVTLVATFTTTGSLTVSGTLQLAGFSMTSGDLQGASIITSSSGTPTITTGSNNTSTSFSGIIGTGAIILTKNGTGVLTLSGSNTYTGITTVSAGTLKLGSTDALGTTAGATSVTSGAVLDLNGINYSNAETLTLNGTGISTGGALINSSTTAAAYAGNITLSTTAPKITASNPITLSGIISGGNTGATNSLTIAGNSTLTGSLTLSGVSANTYTGVTTVNAGALLKIGKDNALGAFTANSTNNSTIITSGGVIDLNGITYTANEYFELDGTGISGSGAMINSSSTTANFACQFDTWYGGTITADNPIILSGTVQFNGGTNNDLTKAGSSTLTLTSSAGLKANKLFITAGTVVLGVNNAIGTIGITTISSGAVLDLNGYSSSRPLTSVNGTGISGGGALTNSSATAATCSGAITLASNASIVGAAGTIAITGTIAGAGFGLTLGGAAGGSVTTVISGASTTVTKIDAGTWIVSGLNTYTGATTVSAGILRATNNSIVASTNGAFGNNASGLLLNGGTIQSNVATFSRPITIAATGSGLDAYGSTRTISSAINNATASSSYNLNVGGTTAASAEGQILTLSGVISNSPGTLSLTKIGTSSVSFSSQAVTINDLTINAGTLTSTSGTLSLAGNFSNSSTFTHNSGTVNFNGSVSQTIGGATFNNCTISNAAGAILAANVTYNGLLTFTSGVITTGSYTLIAPSTATVSRTSGHVYGNFQKNIATGATSKTFEIGDAGNYTPVTVDFANVTTAGNLTASTIAGDHANIGTSTIIAAKTANRNWTLSNSGILFTTYSATFTFVTGDVDAGAITSNFIVGRYSAGWTYPILGTIASTSTQATGLTLFGDFQLGEILVTKTFTGTGNFSDASKWTSGTLPVAGNNLVIDGACTVDNSGTTDNVAYGTLVIGTATGRTLNWIASGTNRLNVSDISAGAGASTLNMTNGGTLIIRGTWTSTNLTFTPGTGTIDVRSAITLPTAYATYYNLTINSPSNTVTASVGTAVTNFSIVAGTVDLNTLTLTVTGTGSYTSGTINNGTVTSTGGTTTFAGTVFGAIVNATSNNLYLNGSTFNNTTSLTKSGGTNAVGTGGNIYNGVTTLVNSGSGSFDLGNTLPETFNANLTVNITGASRVQIGISSVGNQFNGNTTINHGGNTVSLNTIIARNPGSTATFNGNLTLNSTNLNAVSGIVISNEGNVTINGNVIVSSTNGRGIVFSDVAGSVTLAAGYTISDAGAGSFTTGTLKLSRFSQAGATAQNTTLTGTALLQIGPSSTFNGNVTFVSPQVLLHGCTYNGTASLTKNGSTSNLGNGGNTFNGATTLASSSADFFATGYTAADIFNADLTITNTGTGFTALADNAAGTMFNGNIIVNSTNGTGGAGITFGNGPGTAVTATLASGKTISVGGTGFTAGRLLIRRLIQSGATAQSFTLTGTSVAYVGPYSTFNGDVNFISPQIYLNGCTYNGTASLTKNGTTNNLGIGGNTFNGATAFANSSNAYFATGYTAADIFNADLTITNTGSGFTALADAATGTMFNGNIIVNSTNGAGGAGITFGNGAGTAVTATLAAGKTISVGGTGFTAGMLLIRRFTQSGATAQSFTLTGTSTAYFGPYSTFNGAVNFISPQLGLNGCQFNGTSILTKNGATDNTSTGGNIFNGATTITNSGAGFLRLANTTADDFNSDVTFIQTGSGLLQPAYGSNCTIAGNLSTAGTVTAIAFGTGAGTVTLNGTGAQSIGGSLSPTFYNLIISNTGNTVTPVVNSSITNNLSVTSGTFDLGSFTANRLTAGGTLTVSNGATLKVGGTNTVPSNFSTHSIGATSIIEYSGTNQAVAVLNSSQNYGHLAVSGSGTEIISGNLAISNNLSITAGSLNINTYTLKIGGSITNSGTFTASNGTIEMNGTSAQTIPASTFSGNVINGLTINNTAGVTLSGALSLTDVLTVSNGSITTGGYLTLKSSAIANARVAQITSVAATPINGNVTVERYVQGRRKYRLVSSSVTTHTNAVLIPGQEGFSIWGNWQNSGINTTPNVGGLITGGSSADGFDPGTPNASLYTYNDVTRSFVGYSSANGKNTKYTSLKAGVAYLMFVYGDRLNSVFATNPHNTVLIATGTLKTGDQAYNTGSAIPLSAVTGRFTLLGNPFASPIDWATITKTNLDNTYWGWDPNLSSTGGYITVTTTGTITLQAPYSGSTGLNQYIQPGQGFFVKTAAPSPTLTIRELDKVSNFNGNTFRSGSSRMANDIPLLAINLQYVNAGNKILADGVLAAFDTSFSKQAGSEDAVKMANSGESMAILNDTTSLSIDARQMPLVNDTLFLNVSRLTKPQYSLQVFAQQMEGSSIQVFLEDRYLNTLQPLLLNDTNNIVFNVSAGIPASSDINRFRVVFHPITVVLPVKITSVNAVPKNKDIQVDWKVAEESGIKKYEVERSADGVHFIKTGEVNAKGNGTSESYHWLDIDPMAGNNYYRIRAIQLDGIFFLSNIVVVKINVGNPFITIYPNPVKNKEINLHLDGMQKGSYTLLLYNQQGQLIKQRLINYPGGSFTQIIALNKMLPGGIYHLQVANEKEKFNQIISVE